MASDPVQQLVTSDDPLTVLQDAVATASRLHQENEQLRQDILRLAPLWADYSCDVTINGCVVRCHPCDVDKLVEVGGLEHGFDACPHGVPSNHPCLQCYGLGPCEYPGCNGRAVQSFGTDFTPVCEVHKAWHPKTDEAHRQERLVATEDDPEGIWKAGDVVAPTTVEAYNIPVRPEGRFEVCGECNGSLYDGACPRCARSQDGLENSEGRPESRPTPHTDNAELGGHPSVVANEDAGRCCDDAGCRCWRGSCYGARGLTTDACTGDCRTCEAAL